jgi:hypothetical protein
VEGGVSGEMFFLFAKVQPFLKEIREKMQSPRLLWNVEKVVFGSKASKERFQLISKRVEARRKAIAEAK